MNFIIISLLILHLYMDIFINKISYNYDKIPYKYFEYLIYLEEFIDLFVSKNILISIIIFY